MKKNKENGNIVILITIYFICFIFISTTYSFFSEQLELNGTVGFSIDQDKQYEEDHLLQNSWQQGNYYYYQYNLNVKYTGNKIISSWAINVNIPLSTEVTGCYNASECIINDTTMRITNASWNGNMTNNTIVSPSFIIKTTDNNYQLKILSVIFYTKDDIIDTDDPINSGENESTISGITANLKTNNYWGNITQFELEIKNESDVTLSSWELRYQIPTGAKITNIWGGNYVIKDNILILTGIEWSKNIPAGSTNNNVGFQVETTSQAPTKLNLISFKGTNSNQENVEIKI